MSAAPANSSLRAGFIAAQARFSHIVETLFPGGTMKPVHFRFTLAAAALLGIASAPALAQRVASPEQRIERLERQLRQVQGRLFPGGQPVDTAGTVYEPAATQASVSAIDNRLVAVERMMADVVRQSEENGHLLRTIEADLRALRTDQERRIARLEARIEAASAAAAVTASDSAGATDDVPPPAPRPRIEARNVPSQPVASDSGAATDEEAAEEAYSVGFRLWRDGKYDQAIAALRAFTSAYPNHRRVSWANNLAGRAMLDDGEPRAAAEALLANYRSNPRGERAADSLFYLGRSLMALGQPGQACRAYAELEDVYGATMRDELRSLLPGAKAAANCD